jgi:D-glycero-alpha-D-manno-heptose 1-phosphate guanylyltransferase
VRTRDIIILAGGLGTRLQEELPGLPKILAPIGSDHFVDHLIRYYHGQGFERFIFSLGHLHEQVINYVERNHTALDKEYVVEDTPLGTGGAINKTLEYTRGDTAFVINGDTYFAFNPEDALAFHDGKEAECTVVLKQVGECSRYGNVLLNQDQRVISFQEKGRSGSGLINAGTYIINKKLFRLNRFPEKFSFETDYLSAKCSEKSIFGHEQDAFFIDIGVPEDLDRAAKAIKEYELGLA